MKPGLYIVGTPIGNLQDITLRALETLKAVSLIACENTRFSQKLLTHYSITTPVTAYNDHSDDKTRDRLLKTLQQQQSVALISDAGMPLISDPGYKLLAACAANNIYVTAIPGPSAATTAISLSGLPTDRFFFQGFLPPKGWQEALAQLAPLKATLVFFESAKRLLKTLEKCRQILGNRTLVIVRELTKTFEEKHSTTLDCFLESPHLTLKGEITFLLGAPFEEAANQRLEMCLQNLLPHHSLKESVTLACKETGLSKKTVYARALALQRDQKPLKRS